MRRNTDIDMWNRIIALVFGSCVMIAALGLVGLVVSLSGTAQLRTFLYVYMLMGGSVVAFMAYQAMQSLHQDSQRMRLAPVRIRRRG